MDTFLLTLPPRKNCDVFIGIPIEIDSMQNLSILHQNNVVGGRHQQVCKGKWVQSSIKISGTSPSFLCSNNQHSKESAVNLLDRCSVKHLFSIRIR